MLNKACEWGAKVRLSQVHSSPSLTSTSSCREDLDYGTRFAALFTAVDTQTAQATFPLTDVFDLDLDHFD